MTAPLCAAALALCLAAAPPPGSAIVTVRSDGTLVKDGRPLRAIGVNYFDCFARTLKDASDTSYEAGFAALEARGIPFARFMCGGFWPSDMRLYREDPAEYWRRLDKVVDAAQRHHVGLIPSLFWNMNTLPDLAGEPCDQWGNPASKTHALMRDYVRAVVQRYKASPTIWAWEFGNEYNLAADLPNASEHRPPVWPDLGTAASRSARDELTHEMVRTALAMFAREVRRYDKVRPITSGNAFPRPSAWHQMHEHSWGTDSPEQSAEMLTGDHPNPVNLLCVHAYEDYERIAGAAKTSKAVRKPLFVGEFGVQGGDTPENRKRFAAMLDVLEREKVPLAALWVYDYGEQDTWGVTARNARAWQLEAIAEANRKVAAANR